MEIEKIDALIERKEGQITALKAEISELRKKRETAEQLKIMTVIKANKLSYDDLVSLIKDGKEETLDEKNS